MGERSDYNYVFGVFKSRENELLDESRIESLLKSAGFEEAVPQIPESPFAEELRKLKNESGIELSEIGGLRLTVKPEYIDKVSKLTRHADMSRGLLRVLSVITRYEPVTQSDLVKVLGNRVYEYIKELEERGFVKTEKHSRTKKISTTKLFEEYFGAKKEDIKNLAK